MKPSARHLILDLLLASDNHQLLAREAIVACRLFQISENSVRVALARLSAEGLIQAGGRGSYQLAPAAMELAGDVATWRSAEQRLRSWQGDWLVVFSAALGRSDRTRLKRRERALQMLGFRELTQGLHVRPNNIEQDVATVRRRLHGLGLEPEASLFSARDWSEGELARLHTLWDTQTLNQQYLRMRDQLNAWMARADQLEPEEAARESFVLGGQAIRQVVFDPWLPEPMVDVSARHDFFATVHAYDQLGHRIWRTLWRADAPERGR